ncbi:MAG: 50S ribosomal protein L13 [Caldivirga sp.]|uniref:50S ribosomal protein L13 n=1 Tax=Caldivirga sp. TaxID=2080243 RepID=UPI003D12E452
MSEVKVLNKGELPKENEVVINASNHVAGRLATVVAKLALQGKRVVIINAENAVITGDRNMVIDWFKRRMSEIRTHYNPEKVGPKWPRRPDRILRRIIRGMLPYKRSRGKIALKRIRIYMGVPSEYSNREVYVIPGSMLKPRPGLKYVTLGEIWASIEPSEYEAWKEAQGIVTKGGKTTKQ